MAIPLPAALAALAFAALASGCAGLSPTVKVPAEDSTPPLIALDVVGSGKRMMLFSGEGPQTVEIGPTIHARAEIVDPRGLVESAHDGLRGSDPGRGRGDHEGRSRASRENGCST